jgi:hypothetical protein
MVIHRYEPGVFCQQQGKCSACLGLLLSLLHELLQLGSLAGIVEAPAAELQCCLILLQLQRCPGSSVIALCVIEEALTSAILPGSVLV